MRDIEFKGQDEFGEWHHGDLTHESWGIQVNKHTVIPESVGQYCGREDMNGVKIYEHDVVELLNPIRDEVVGERILVYDNKNMRFIFLPFNNKYPIEGGDDPFFHPLKIRLKFNILDSKLTEYTKETYSNVITMFFKKER